VNALQKFIVVAATCALSALVVAAPQAAAQTNNAGGAVGVTEKSVSSGNNPPDSDTAKTDHVRSHRRSAHESRQRSSDPLCSYVRSAVRAATAAGLDNGTGLIAAARAHCGG
jgi:hypothetical protein